MSYACLHMTLSRWVLLLIAFFSLVAIGGNFAIAQSDNTEDLTTSEVTPSLSIEVTEFKRLLADPKIQSWLQTAVTETNVVHQDQGLSTREQLDLVMTGIRSRFHDLREAALNIESAPQIIAQSWREEMSRTESLRVIIYLVIFLFVGAGFEWLYSQYTHFRLMALELQKPETLQQRISTAALRAFITFGSLLIFAIGSIGAFLMFDWPEVVDSVVLDVLIIVLVVRAATTISRFFLAPRFKNLRLVPFSNIQAKTIHRWLAWLVFIGITNFAVSDVFQQITSMSNDQIPKAAALSIDVLANLIWLLAIITAIWTVRNFFVAESRNGEKETANVWPIYLTIVAITVFVLWLVNTTNLMWSVLILGLLFPITILCRNWVDNLFDQAENIDELHGNTEITPLATKDIELEVNENELPLTDTQSVDETDSAEVSSEEFQRYETYRPVARRLVRFVVIISAVAALILTWNNSIAELSSSTTLGGKLFEIAVDVVIALLIADLIWVWAKSAIDRRLANYRAPTDGQAPGPEARMATLLPLLRTILMVTLLATAILSILSSFGVNIGPLLAGAGVVGVAIGFGAQALVRDVVSGIFFLIDDAFRIGEYIEIDNLRGTVESMSIRSLRVRHHRGAVHTIPFGELKSLTNHSRDWVIMKLEFRVPFETDLKLVKKLVKKIGAELIEHPEYGPSIIETLKSQGVRRMEEFNMVVGVKFMTKPGEQWIIRREAYQKVRDAFDANGIGFAERNVKVEVLGDKPLDKETKKAVMGAAQNAIEKTLPPAPIPDEP